MLMPHYQPCRMYRELNGHARFGSPKMGEGKLVSLSEPASNEPIGYLFALEHGEKSCGRDAAGIQEKRYDREEPPA